MHLRSGLTWLNISAVICKRSTDAFCDEWGPCSCDGIRSRACGCITTDFIQTEHCDKTCKHGRLDSSGCVCPEWRYGACCEGKRYLTRNNNFKYNLQLNLVTWQSVDFDYYLCTTLMLDSGSFAGCRHIHIDHCVDGKQACRESPDSIQCTQCYDPYYPAGYGIGCKGKRCLREMIYSDFFKIVIHAVRKCFS